MKSLATESLSLKFDPTPLLIKMGNKSSLIKQLKVITILMGLQKLARPTQTLSVKI